ncbi:FAD-dependent monooxygenase [Streptomyces sp. NPDC058676]|uniref:FAD-dependent monooxygenase n=1 Tax=Streptomyces sp. NPDC058676 TaxID=3346593 RepID=UPI0036610117
MNSQDNRHATGLRVAVVGGGIGGLATAAFLHRAGIASTVYEQAPALAEVGAGLVVSPNAVRLLRSLGQLDRLRERAVPLQTGWERGTAPAVPSLTTTPSCTPPTAGGSAIAKCRYAVLP